MKEKNFDTVKNDGNKNSIEETIKIIERKIKEAERYSDITGLCLTLDEELRNAIMNILSDYKRVLEMNEALLKENEILKDKKKENEKIKEANDYWRSRYCEISNNSISKQKIKDKIEELKKEKEEYYSQYKIDELNDKIQVLQELLESEE